jgi:hypothetical protein
MVELILRSDYKLFFLVQTKVWPHDPQNFSCEPSIFSFYWCLAWSTFHYTRNPCIAQVSYHKWIKSEKLFLPKSPKSCFMSMRLVNTIFSENTSPMHQKQGKIPSMNLQTFHFANEFKRAPKTFLNQISNCKQSSLNLCFRDTPCMILRQISTSIKGPQASELMIQKFTQKKLHYYTCKKP